MTLYQQLVDLIEKSIYETPEHINGVWLSNYNLRQLKHLIDKVETLEYKAKLLEESSNEIFERDKKLTGEIISKLLDI